MDEAAWPSDGDPGVPDSGAEPGQDTGDAPGDCGSGTAELRVPEDLGSIDAAIDAAVDGDVICVAPGVWGPVDFGGKGVALVGRGGPAENRLEGPTQVVRLASGEQGAALVGWTVTGSTAGSAVVIEQAVARLEDLRVVDNQCSAPTCTGVGVDVLDSALTLVNVEIGGNRATAEDEATGVGMRSRASQIDWTGGTIGAQEADVSAGYVLGLGLALDGGSVATLEGVDIVDNVGQAPSFYSGGVYVGPGARLVFTGGHIAGNEGTATAYFDGAGLGSFGEVVLTNAVIADNHAHGPQAYVCGGGVISHGTHMRATNVTVVGNSAEGTVIRGAGWYNRATDTELRNISISGNVSWASEETRGAQLGVTGDEDPVLWYSNVIGGEDALYGIAHAADGQGNLVVDPGFVDLQGDDWRAWDLRLGPESGLLDAGDPNILDADGSISDVGAHGGPGAVLLAGDS